MNGYGLLASVVVTAGILYCWSLVTVNKKKEPKPLIDIGKTKVYLEMTDGTTQTISIEGRIYSNGYYLHSAYRVQRALDGNWIEADDGTIYNRNQISSYTTKTVEYLVPCVD